MDKIATYKKRSYRKVIIDTDGGIDDMRSIVVMLSLADNPVVAITVSNGILSADEMAALYLYAPTVFL